MTWISKMYTHYLAMQRLIQIFTYFGRKYNITSKQNVILAKLFTNLEDVISALFFLQRKTCKSNSFFYSCTEKKFLPTLLQNYFYNVLIIPPITLQGSIFGFTDHKVHYGLINHTLLIFKYYVYKTRYNGPLDLKVIKRNIHKIKNIGKQISIIK